MIAEGIGTNGTSGIDGNADADIELIVNGTADADMSDTQKQKLRALLDRVEREAYARGESDGYAKGYEAACRDAESLIEGGPTKSKGELRVTHRANAKPSDTEQRLAKGFIPRFTTGQVDKLVASALERVAPRQITQTELLHTIKEEFDTIVPFSTMSRSLKRLLKNNRARYDEETQLWSLGYSTSPELKLRSVT